MKKSKFKKIIFTVLLIIILTVIIGFYSTTADVFAGYIKYRSEAREKVFNEIYEYKELKLITEDKIDIYGELAVPINAKSIAILVPGYDMDHNSLIPIANILYKNNIATINLDLRTRGKSGGEVKGAAYTEIYDVKAAIDYIKKDKELNNLKIVLIGHSMGAATVLNVGDESVTGVIAIAGYTDFFDMVKNDDGVRTMPPVIRDIIPIFGKISYGFTLGFNNLKSPIETAKKLEHMSYLIIHQKEDKEVSYDMALEYKEALSSYPNFKLLTVEGSENHFPWIIDKKEKKLNDEVLKEIVDFIYLITN